MSNTINTTSPNVAIPDKPNQFPWKLYDMLDMAERRNEEHVISWIKDGRAFKVHNRDLFIEQYMKKMFNQTKFKSFQRQLNLWGFERVQSGPDKGSYFHPLFVKGQKGCCQRLSRVRLRGTTGDKTGSPFSPHSASSTASETISTTGAAIFPVTVTASSAVEAGNDTAATSPISLFGAFLDVSGSTSSTTATETSVHGDSRQQQQFADLIQYHISDQRREMIRNAAIGLSPDHFIAVVETPVFATAADTSQRGTGEEDLQQHHQEYKQLPTHQIEGQQKVEGQEPICLLQQQQQLLQERIQIEQQPQIDQEQQSHRRSTFSGLEALLSVSAQRRREEELALLAGLSDHGAMSHTR